MISIKQLLVPFSNKTRSVDVAQLWEVRWTSLRFPAIFSADEKYPDPQPEIETFLTESEAQTFVESLQAARQLLKISGMKPIQLRKAK